MTTMDWRSELINFMVEGGLLGHKQSVIVARLDAFANAKQIEAELSFLAADDMVQKFNIPPTGRRGGRRYVVWRATNKIMEMAS